MSSVLMVACDDHSRKMVLKVGLGKEAPVTWRSGRSKRDRERLRARLGAEAQRRGAEKIVFAYEASGLGFGLHDELRAAGIECHVLAPSKMSRSPKQRKNKNDEKDAALIYEVLKAHVLAGNHLPNVWVPPPEVRDDRECVRGRLDVGEKIGHLKVQIQSLLQRHQVQDGPAAGGCTRAYRAWLVGLTKEDSPLGAGARTALASLYRQLLALEGEQKELDQAVLELAEQPRWARAVQALDRIKGVGILLAMVFLTELGDVRRFANRKKLGSALGLVPCCDETGEVTNRKGHITKQGPGRLRKLLCQASWSRVGRYGDPQEKLRYYKMLARNGQKKKVAIVAFMRRLGTIMYHVAKEVALEEKGPWTVAA